MELDSQRKILKRNDFKISCMSTKYINCNFDLETLEVASSMMIKVVEVTKCMTFCYL